MMSLATLGGFEGEGFVKKVDVFGGGVAGLTVAHELVLRGYEVRVLEKREGAFALGGKARSQRVVLPNGREVLGEHGYRFFPAFYETVPDTMRRIPLVFPAQRPGAREPVAGSVYDTMQPAEHMGIARRGVALAVVERQLPQIRELPDIGRALMTIFRDVPLLDTLPVLARLLHYVTRGPMERLEVYEKQTFWSYMHADALHETTRAVLEYTPKSLVAMRATEGNTRTLMDAFLLMMLDFAKERPSDLVLPGPTTRAWIDPWVAWLRELGVIFETGVSLHHVELDGERVRGWKGMASDGTPREGSPDALVIALPPEAAAPVARASIAAGHTCAELELVARFPVESALGWMVGLQLFLDRDRPLVGGHVALGDSSWALSAVSQRQFWNGDARAELDAAGVGGVLSVIATEWDRARHGRRAARAYDREGFLREVLEQIDECRGVDGEPLLGAGTAAQLLHAHVDEELVFDPATGLPGTNHARLLVHPPGLWEKRPEPYCEDVENLYFAGDYVRNPMDLATMEGASSSARIAVNRILERDHGPAAERCLVIADYQALNDPPFLAAIKDANDLAYLGARRHASHDHHGFFDLEAESAVPDSRDELFGRVLGLLDAIRGPTRMR